MKFKRFKNIGTPEEQIGAAAISRMHSIACMIKDGCPADQFVDISNGIDSVVTTIWNLLTLSRVTSLNTPECEETCALQEQQLRDSIDTIIKTERENRKIRDKLAKEQCND